jgi:glycosyltransferase involved in cell wall biosynthesis
MTVRRLRIYSIACVPLSSVEGPATHVRELHEALGDRGVHVTLWLPDLGLRPRSTIDGVETRLVRVPNISILRYLIFDVFMFLAMSWDFIRGRRPDVLYLRQSYSTLLPAILAWCFRVPMIVEVNGFFEWDLKARNAALPVRVLSKLGERLSYGVARRIICVTEGIKEQLDATYGTTGKTVVVRNGVDVDDFCPLPRDRCREELQLTADAIVLGYVGCFTPWDGIGSLVTVAPKLLERFPNLQFLLVGDGHESDDVRERVRAAGLDERFIFPGFVEPSRLNAFICSFDLALAPYIPGRNAMGVSSLKCLEYFACGVPAVVGSVPEMGYIESSGGGRLFAAGDDDAFIDTVSCLLAAMEKLPAMGQQARQYVESSCTWKRVATQTYDLLSELCD